jgi:hypothetical protein
MMTASIRPKLPQLLKKRIPSFIPSFAMSYPNGPKTVKPPAQWGRIKKNGNRPTLCRPTADPRSPKADFSKGDGSHETFPVFARRGLLPGGLCGVLL